MAIGDPGIGNSCRCVGDPESSLQKSGGEPGIVVLGEMAIGDPGALVVGRVEGKACESGRLVAVDAGESGRVVAVDAES